MTYICLVISLIKQLMVAGFRYPLVDMFLILAIIYSILRFIVATEKEVKKVVAYITKKLDGEHVSKSVAVPSSDVGQILKSFGCGAADAKDFVGVSMVVPSSEIGQIGCGSFWRQ